MSASPPISAPPAANSLGTGLGKMHITLANGQNQASLCYGQPGQILTVSFTRNGPLTLSPGADPSSGDYIVLRFRPGSLERSDSITLQSPASLHLTSSTTPAGLLEYRIQCATGDTLAAVTPLSLTLAGVLPSPYLIGHVMRVEVEWQMTDNGQPATGSRTLFLAVQMMTSSDLDGALGDIRRMLNPELEAWIEGDGVIVPSVSQQTPVANELTLCMRNPTRLNRPLTNATLSVDLGTDPLTSLDPQTGVTGTWTKWAKDGTSEAATEVIGTDALSRSLAGSWNPGEIAKIQLANLKTQAGAILGKRRIGVSYAAQLPVPAGARLWERRGDNGGLTFGSDPSSPGLRLGRSFALRMTLILPPEAGTAEYASIELVRLAYVDPSDQKTRFLVVEISYVSSESQFSIASRTCDLPTDGSSRLIIHTVLPSSSNTWTGSRGPTSWLLYVLDDGSINLGRGDHDMVVVGGNYWMWQSSPFDYSLVSVGAGAICYHWSALRIWTQPPGNQRSGDDIDYTLPPDSTLLAEYPLDDLDNVPRNTAPTTQHCQVSLQGDWAEPVKDAGKPIEGLLPLEVIVGNLKQSQDTTQNPNAATTTLHGNLSVQAASPTSKMTLGGVDLYAGQHEQSLLVNAAVSFGGPLYTPAVDSTPRTQPGTDPGFLGKNLGGGRYLECNPPIKLGTAWTAEAWFQWPLPDHSSSSTQIMRDSEAGLSAPSTTYNPGWNSLFSGTTMHHLLVQCDIQANNTRMWQLGAWNSGLLAAFTFPSNFPAGRHHIAVVCDGTNWDYYLNGAKVGTIGPGATPATTPPAVEPITAIGDIPKTAIGDIPKGGQSFGPIWGIRVWSVAQVPGTPVPDGVSPVLDLREGEPLPSGVSYASSKSSVPAEPAIPAPEPLRQAPGRLLPDGMIIMWSGSIQEIPVGWHLCDGRKLTESQTKTTIVLPDLRGRMIRGGISAGLASGGSDWVTLTERELPSHTHQVTDNGHSHSSAFLIGNADGGGSDKAYSQNGGSGSGTVDTTSNTTGITIADKGQGLPFSILPAYYELAFLAFYPGYLP